LYIKNNQSEYEKFDVYIWKHNTAKAVGFNGNSGNAKDLSEFIDYLISAKPNYDSKTKFIFVAHSRGGLVCRSYMNYDFDGDGKLDGNKVLGLITLGTPHHGSPLAVPDWVAYYWKTEIGDYPAARDFFDLFLIGRGKAFDPYRIGDLNLAWENLDSSIESIFKNFIYKVNIAYNDKYLCLSPCDPNDSCIGSEEDETNFYLDRYKEQFGTLRDLNEKEQYHKKIVAIAAFDDSLADNNFWTGWNNLDGFIDHGNLEITTALLAEFGLGGFVGGTNVFYANDGLVPLQSALFVDISSGSPFSIYLNGGIVFPHLNIEKHRQVKRHRVFFGEKHNIRDHLDLLDTDNQHYWDTITSEIKAFIANPVPTITSTLLLNSD
jgi:hypothetical protein